MGISRDLGANPWWSVEELHFFHFLVIVPKRERRGTYLSIQT